MYNTKCSFDKNSGQIEFGEMNWLCPIEAITSVKMTEVAGKKIEIHIYSNSECQNEILKKHNLKKISKTERSIEFNISRRTAARDFLWHLKRIHHWWNFA